MNKMKMNHLSCAALFPATLLFTACSKPEDSSQPGASQPASTTSDSLKSNVEAATAEAKKQAEQFKASTEAAVVDAKAKTAETVADLKSQTAAVIDSAKTTTSDAVAAAQAQTYIDKAKAFVTEQKYADAVNTLSQTANLRLTPEQQDLVTKLKTQIQSALQSQGANEGLKAVGGFLEKK